MKRNYLFLMSAALLLQTSCSSDSEQNGQEIQEIQEIVNEVVVNKTPGEIVLTETQRQMAADNCSFSFNLMRELSKNEEGNMVVSPISVGYMLGMLNDGANGTTSEEMMKVLGFGTYDTKAVNEFFGNLMTNAPLVDENVELGIANMLIANSSLGADFAGQYSADMKGYYQAAVESMDFNKADELVNHVNGWCDEKTRGMIPKILEPEDINSSIVAMLLNSVFFKAQWLHPFGKEFTSLKNFTNADGSTVKLPMMENLGGFEFASDELVQAIRLPYKDGHFSMVLIMPTDPGMSLDQLLGSMTDTYWLQLLDKMNYESCHLQMPRFDISTTMDLMEPLSTMGMKAAFRNGQADFKRMFKNDAEPIFINLLKQKAKIQVDEYGTTAAAVTYSYSSGGMPSGAVFNANRPFLYVITEKDSQVIFFIGKVASCSNDNSSISKLDGDWPPMEWKAEEPAQLSEGNYLVPAAGGEFSFSCQNYALPWLEQAMSNDVYYYPDRKDPYTILADWFKAEISGNKLKVVFEANETAEERPLLLEVTAGDIYYSLMFKQETR